MMTLGRRSQVLTALGVLAALGSGGCVGTRSGATGSGGGSGSGDGTSGGTGSGGSGADAGIPDAGVVEPFQAVAQPAYVRKVKGLLTGLAVTDAELAAAPDQTGLRAAIDTWMATPQFQAKMLTFFKNAFQQQSFAVADFAFQLQDRPGAFELPYGIYGDAAYPTLLQNLRESFARTAWQLVTSGQPFNQVLTTQQFMMTTALKSLYLQIEVPRNQTPFYVDESNPNIAITDTLNPASANYLHFSDATPTVAYNDRFAANGTCRGQKIVSTFSGNALLFQVLLGVIPRDTTTGCMEHASKPYFSAADTSDWQLVTIRPQAAGETPVRPFDLPTLRAATTLDLKLPRVGFFTTPAFMATWNTNDSNQHRVTVNQSLLVALGQGFTSAGANIPTPPNPTGLDPLHSVAGSDCYGCHKSLDPMRQFFANAYTFNDEPLTPALSSVANFAFGSVNSSGTTLVDFGSLMGQATDMTDPVNPLSRFAIAMTQQLCYFADSSACAESDPEFRRVALAFQSAKYDFKTLVRELMSSPLVTGAAYTTTFAQRNVVVSIARRDQLCAALSNRLGIADVCALAVPTPVGSQAVIYNLAGAVSADAISRGSQAPVMPSDPDLFYRAASEMVCEAVATAVVDSGVTGGYQSTSAPAAIADMVVKVLGYPPTDPHHDQALSILSAHYAAVMATPGATATNALRSTFSLACQSPTSLSIGI